MCVTCQRFKAGNSAPAGLLQPLPLPTSLFTDLTMDFIEALPTSQGKNTILVVVDRLSKFAHFMALSHPFTAKTVAKVFLNSVFKLHGLPNRIVSDRGSVFMGAFWKDLFAFIGVELLYSTAYHPETDGQSEVVNSVFNAICVVLWVRSPIHGLNGWDWQSIGIIQLTIPASK